MRKRILLFLLLFAVAGLVGLLIAGASREREPEYGGKRLSEWVQNLTYEPPYGEAHEAVLHVGTNAIPYLLKWIQYEPAGWRASLYGTMNLVLNEFVWHLPDKKNVRAEGARHAFRSLGPKAKAAVPDLTRIMLTSKSFNVAWWAG